MSPPSGDFNIPSHLHRYCVCGGMHHSMRDRRTGYFLCPSPIFFPSFPTKCRSLSHRSFPSHAEPFLFLFPVDQMLSKFRSSFQCDTPDHAGPRCPAPVCSCAPASTSASLSANFTFFRGHPIVPSPTSWEFRTCRCPKPGTTPGPSAESSL